MTIINQNTCCQVGRHSDHSETLPRLNRAIGQLEGVKKMIEAGRYCPDIMIQMRAARTAIKNAETEIFKRHLEGCVTNSFNNPETIAEKISEVKKIIDLMN